MRHAPFAGRRARRRRPRRPRRPRNRSAPSPIVRGPAGGRKGLPGGPRREEGEWEDWLLKVRDESRTEVVTADTPGARRAVLRFRRLEVRPGTALLELEPQTGRMHQLRVQAAARGWPVCGDAAYGA